MPLQNASTWHEHRFGVIPGSSPAGVPRGAWVPLASEIPFHPGLLCCPGIKDRSGLFTALVQRAGFRVRTLRGRYLWAQVELFGAATEKNASASQVRAVSQCYLPAYRNGSRPDQSFAAHRADFLERFLDTSKACRALGGVASSYPDRSATVPESIEWLGR
jgi:hypothetical protein